MNHITTNLNEAGDSNYFLNISQHVVQMTFRFEHIKMIVNGEIVNLLKLPVQLGFARKAANLSELKGGETAQVYVFKRVDLSPFDFDFFAQNLCRDAEWLKDQCMALPLGGARACIMVVAPGRPVLFVDTEGSPYARYVARLG